MRKLVSVVTGTWQRHELLLEAIENVRQQEYPNIEHVIVSDGPDVEFRRLMEQQSVWSPTIRWAELGFWSSGLFTDSVSAAPFMVAQLLARGDYWVTLADDERFLVPDAIEKLVDLLEMYGVDFVYPRVEMWRAGQPQRFVIGEPTPMHGQFTHWLAKRETLDRGGLFRTHVGSATDWDCAERMIRAGCRWMFLPEVTLSHEIHK